ncbi:preprotein translocase subunit SecG [Patescibacteria group bacterium]
MNENTLNIIQIILCVTLVIVILFQNQGSAMSGILGGGMGTPFRTKRGMEKKLFIFTIVLVVAFFAFSIFRLFV